MDEKLTEQIEAYYIAYYRDALGIPHWRELVAMRLDEKSIEAPRLACVTELVGSLAGKRVLNVGCGTGGFNVLVARQGATSFGVEPNAQAVAICRVKAQEEGMPVGQFQVAVAEALPYHDSTFDLVYCHTVLEHVQDVNSSLAEMIRVTRPGGFVYLHSPNYLACYEGHYKVFWLPLFPRPLARVYLRWLGRPTAFLDTLNYLTPRWVRSLLKDQPVQVQFFSHLAHEMAGRLRRLVNAYYRIARVDAHIEVLMRRL